MKIRGKGVSCLADILVFRTSADGTMKRLFEELGEKNIDCLIQTSQLERYKSQYPNINFIDIRQEGFYELPTEVVKQITEKRYGQLYVTFSGVSGHNYGNVMRIVSKIDSSYACFYNCNGERVEIPKKNVWKDFLCRLYIEGIKFVYGN